MMTRRRVIAEQLSFFVEPDRSVKRTIQEQFEEFHRLNPWVFTQLVFLARRAKEMGQKKIGIGMLFEVMRWQYYENTRDPNAEWKLNNNYRSRYTRLLIQQVPDLAGMFEQRQLKTP